MLKWLQATMMESYPHDPGVKKLTISNWQESDEAASMWRKMTAVAKTESEWANFFLIPTLRSEVPTEIAKLLDVARASMIYSWYYYPLATLGMEQCYRVAEAGVRARCEREGIATTVRSALGKEKPKPFWELIDELKRKSVIPKTDALSWEMTRQLRNSTSHPQIRSIYDPGQAQGMLELIVDSLNELFR